jgi:hypothetical protein
VAESRRIWVNEITEGEFAGCFSQFVHDSLQSALEGREVPTDRPVEFVEVRDEVSSQWGSV